MSGNKRFSLAIKIALYYLIFGILWIIATDILKEKLSENLQILRIIELSKGIVFILITSLLLYIFAKKNIERLIISEERYKKLFNTHQTVMLVFDAHSGKIMDANKAAQEFYCYSYEEFKNLNIADLTILDKKTLFSNIELVKTGKKNNFQLKHRLKNGELWDVETYCSFMELEGQPIIYQVVFNITDRLYLENKNKELIEWFNTIIESSPLPIIIVDRSGNVEMWNRSAERVFGWSREEVIGKFNPIVPADKIAEFLANLDKISKGEIIENLEIKRVNKNGDVLTLNLFTAAIYNQEGNIIHFIGIFQDVTEKIKIEQEMFHFKKMESVGRLAAGIAHDINNSLTAIINFSSLIDMKTKDQEDINSYAKQILLVCERIATITKGLMTYSKKYPFNPKIVSLNEIINQALPFLQKVIGERITLKFELDPDIRNIKADIHQIEQILVNLLSNAKDSMPDGGTVLIKTCETEIDERFIIAHNYGKKGRYIKLSVTDTGTGIPDNIKNKIFEPFFTTKEPGKGTGLGLSIVYSLVKQHGGYINLYSESGKGTTINIYFPATEDEQSKEAPILPNIKIPEKLGVLVAEDDIMVRKALKHFFSEIGYRFFEACTGKEAINIYKENMDQIDLLILDIVLPDISGFEIFKEIKKLEKNVKKIYISGYPMEMLKDFDSYDESAEFIHKPLTVISIKSAISRLFNGS